MKTRLKQIEVYDVKIKLEIEEHEIARPKSPGVVLFFNGKHGEIAMPCDTYDSWTANLRALSLTLTALRAVDRYGASKSGEQYRGWQQLSAPALPPGPMEVEAELIPSSNTAESRE